MLTKKACTRLTFTLSHGLCIGNYWKKTPEILYHMGPALVSAAEPLLPGRVFRKSDLPSSWQISSSALPILVLLSFVAFVGYVCLDF